MAADALRWRLPRSDWAYHALQYRKTGTLRSRFQCRILTRYNKWRSIRSLYEPGWRFMMRRYERALGRGDYDRLAYWSEHRPRETGYGIHNNDWWHM